MPIYEFTCPQCGAAFDKLVRHAAGVHEVSCPRCGNSQVKKKLSGFAVQTSGETTSGANCAPGGT